MNGSTRIMTKESRLQAIKDGIVSYPDFPKKGIIFRDILPVLQNPHLFEDILSLFAEHLSANVPEVEGIAGLEARGFLFGPTLALKLAVPFIPIRKPGKLPGTVIRQHYSLEYGSDALELQTTSIKPGSKIVIVDDLLATGGSMQAAVKLVKQAGAIVPLCLICMELSELNGRKNVSEPVFSLVQY